jgi:hypothetical protein
VNNAFLRALAENHNCIKASQRARSEDAVLQIKELCYFGAGYYVLFTLENRGRQPFDVADVTVQKSIGRHGGEPVTEAEFYLPSLQVEFRQTVTGVVGFQLAEGEKPARAYHLMVLEGGGKGRSITISRFGF